MNYIPVENKILVLVEKPKDETESGILLVPDAQKKTNRGVVMATGPGLMGQHGERLPMQVQVGDVVAYPDHAGTKIEIDGEESLCLREVEIHLVMREG